VFPDPPELALLPAPPPPDPPDKPVLAPDPSLPAAPPPVLVIVLKIEFDPELRVVLFVLLAPPPPTVIGYVEVVIVIPVGVAKGLAV
jgi:hypothetical protein